MGGGAGSSSSDIEVYQATVGLSAFELDLFGRVRNLSRAAQEQYFASEEAQRSARISLIAEIANAWLTMASDSEQLRLSRETAKAFEETLRLTREQFRVGVGRSEEHTSELQSLMRISYAVLCLKKKKKSIRHVATEKKKHNYNTDTKQP